MTAQETAERFGDAMSSEAISAEIADRVPKNTSLTMYLCSQRMECLVQSSQYIQKPVAKMSLEEMDEYLSHFVFEARHQDGNPYPHKTLYQLVCGLQ